MTAPLIRSIAKLRHLVTDWKRSGANIGVVPTMGALHEGHLSLVRAAAATTDRVIVTVFVNPKQFNNPGDLQAYPQTEKEDARKLAPFGVDAIFAPNAAEMYPRGFATTVSVAGVSEGLCGARRAGHFDGVATIVTKLLMQTGADFAFFGNKDYQQLQVVRRLVQDLDIPCKIIGCPTVREGDGLAMSSRNALLSPDERSLAAKLHKALIDAALALERGADVLSVIKRAQAEILAGGFGPVEYLELRDAETLTPISQLDRPARLLAAAYLGNVRLIDNVPLPGKGRA